MLQFHPLSLSDRETFLAAMRRENTRNADCAFGNIYLWDDIGKRLVAESESGCGTISLFTTFGRPAFQYPFGSSDPAAVLEEMRIYSEQAGGPMLIFGLEARHTELLETLYPGKFRFTENREFADYLYDAQALATLSGRHLHAKRNHINRFESTYQWSFRALDAELLPACEALFHNWRAKNPDTDDADEAKAMRLAFAAYDAVGLLGGVLFADGKPVAFTMGELLGADTLDVHFEKADDCIDGAYPMVNREFVRMVLAEHPEIRYINREDDMGLDNLRKSKLSYHPSEILMKYTAEWIDV